MATYITVEQQSAAQLLEASRRQTLANRQGLRDEQAALQVAVPSAARPAGRSRRAVIPGDELAAFRRRRLDGFGFIDINDAYNFEGNDAYFASSYKVNLAASLSRYKAIRIVVASPSNSCVLPGALPASFFGGAETVLGQFINSGGILWINNEFTGCGINAATFNQYLASNFGASIGFVNDLQDEGPRDVLGPFDYGVVRSPLVYMAKQASAPLYFYTAATASISGGVPYYGNQFGVVCAFQKIGNGYLVLSGDSNGTAQYPSFTENARTFIDALIALR